MPVVFLTLPYPILNPNPNPTYPILTVIKQPGSGSFGVVKYARRVLNSTLPYPQS